MIGESSTCIELLSDPSPYFCTVETECIIMSTPISHFPYIHKVEPRESILRRLTQRSTRDTYCVLCLQFLDWLDHWFGTYKSSPSLPQYFGRQDGYCDVCKSCIQLHVTPTTCLSQYRCRQRRRTGFSAKLPFKWNGLLRFPDLIFYGLASETFSHCPVSRII